MRPIDADALEKDMREYADNKAYCGHIELANGILKAVGRIDDAPTMEAIPIAVIKHAIAGISAADQCDQAGRYERELRDALNKVLEWYGSPGYQEHAKRAAHG